MSNKAFNLPLLGGLLAAIGSGVCCVGPLVLLLMGISGSWISTLTLLEPYRPIFIILVLSAFVYAGRQIFRPVELCSGEKVCSQTATQQRRKLLFWVAALVALILVSSSYWIGWFIES